MEVGTTIEATGISHTTLRCREGGKASIFAPSYSIEQTGSAVEKAEKGKAESTRAQTELVKAETQQAASAPELVIQKQIDKRPVIVPVPVKPKGKK